LSSFRFEGLLGLGIGVMVVLGSVNANSSRNVGFAWLKVPVGTGVGGMAGTGTAVADGASGIVYNPAASARITQFSIQVDYTRWFLDMKQQSVFVTRDLKLLSVGVGVVSFSSGKLEYRENRPTEEAIGTFSPFDITGYLNLSRTLGDQVDVGVNARFYYSKIFSYQTSGWGADIGLRFWGVKNLTVGATVVDFCRALSYKYEQFWLPTRGKIGVAYRLTPGRSLLTFAVDGIYFFYNKELSVSTGVEWRFTELFSLRAGYAPFNGANKLSLGAGIHRGLFRVDYAYLPLNFNLGAAHRFGISFGY